MQSNRKILNLCIAIVIIGLPIKTQAQMCDSFLSRVETENQIYTRENRSVSRRDLRKNIDEIKAQMLNELKIKMAEKILTEVKTSSRSSVLESGEVFEDFYNYESEISTTASLAFGREDYCVDKKNKVIYGIYSLDRVKTAQAVVLDCENRMGKLLAEIRQANLVDRTRSIDIFESRSEKINRDARIASFLDTNSDPSRLINLYEQFQSEFQLMQTKAGQNNYREELIEAQKLIDKKEYSRALSNLKHLNIEYPKRDEVNRLIEDAETRFYSQTINRVMNLKTQEKYKEALLELDELCKSISCNTETIELRTEIVSNYFDQEYMALEKAIKFDLKKQAELHYQVLSRMAGINPKDFDRATRDYKIFQIEADMREVEKDLDYKNYHAAFAEVKNIQYEYSISHSPLDNLRKRTEYLLLRYEVKKEKRKRRKLFSIAIGVEAVSNANIEIGDAFDPQTYSLGYSVGLYKKFNYVGSYRGSYPKASDLIGIKFRLVDFWNTYSLPPNENIIPSYAYRYNSELLIDGTAVQYLHYSLGVVFADRDLRSDLAYCGEIGLRVPLGPVSLQTNLRYLTSQGDSFYMLHAGLFGHFDFWRNFGPGDRKGIKKKFGL